MQLPAPRNGGHFWGRVTQSPAIYEMLYLGACDVFTHLWKWWSFLEAGDAITYPLKIYFYRRIGCCNNSTSFVVTGYISPTPEKIGVLLQIVFVVVLVSVSSTF